MVASIRRYLAVTGKGWSLVVVAAATTVATTATAADLPAQYCRLSRTPALSTPLERQADCSRDEDGNRLDDAVENELAKCFVPTVAFDSAENALAPGEPRVVFSARLVGANVIRFRYVFLFKRDTGYVLGTSFPCLKYDHNGDLQIVEVDATWIERDQEWYGAPLAMYASSVESNVSKVSVSGTGPDRLVLSNTHPVIFATAGKHHWSFRPRGAFSYGCDCGPFGRCGQVRESADGLGPTITAATVRHAPGFYFAPENGVDVDPEARLRPQSPMLASDGRFSNTCEYVNHGRIVPAQNLMSSNSLDDIGYEGERILGPCFRGGLGGDCTYTGSVADALASGAPFGSYANPGKLRTWLHDNAEPTRGGSEMTKLDLHFAGPDSLIPIGLEAFPGLNQLVDKFRGDPSGRSWTVLPKDGARRR